jgi:hypothetical protein
LHCTRLASMADANQIEAAPLSVKVELDTP